MEPTDLTIQILQGIRDELRRTREELSARIDQTNVKLDQTNVKLDQNRQDLAETRDDVAHRIVDSELRLATAVGDMVKTTQDLKQLLKEQLELRPRVEKCEQEIAAIKSRLPDA
jgi:chromosome segregation ATPase